MRDPVLALDRAENAERAAEGAGCTPTSRKLDLLARESECPLPVAEAVVRLGREAAPRVDRDVQHTGEVVRDPLGGADCRVGAARGQLELEPGQQPVARYVGGRIRRVAAIEDEACLGGVAELEQREREEDLDVQLRRRPVPPAREPG